LVAELLSHYPESAYLETNLGELPLHLTVDKACAPEVVNLIIVANWRAIVSQDQAGRTPLDIIDRSELMQFEDYRIVYDSLTRCHKTYMEVQKAAQEEQAALKRKHKATYSAISKRHQEEIRIEQDKQAKLRDDMEELRMHAEGMKESSTAKDHHIQKLQNERQRWMDVVRDLESKVAGLNRELESEKGQIRVLLYKIEQKEKEIHNKEARIEVLSKDLRSVVKSNETDIMECLVETEQSMRTMVSSQIALQKLLTAKSKDLNSLLKQRGIPLRNATKSPIENKDEEKIEADLEVECDQANAAMMAAATAALKP
jgi:chromosome segregation ATPase